MEGYLKAVQGGYLTVNETAAGAAVTAGKEQPGVESLVVIENYDPVAKRAAADPVIRSQNLVTLRAPSGSLLAPAGEGDAPKLIASGPMSAPRMGYDVLRIFKVGGEKGDEIRYGDRVVFRFTNAAETPVSSWMSTQRAGESGIEVVFRSEVKVPQDAEMFDLVMAVDLADFSIDYNELTNELVGQIVLTASAPPGGQTVILESPDAPDLFPQADLALENEQSAAFSVELPDPFVEISPCRPRMLTIRATFATTGTCIESQVKLEGDRAHFMTLKMAGARKVKGGLSLARVTLAEVNAVLGLDPLEKRLPPESLPLNVAVSGDETIRELVQDSYQLSFDESIKLTFQVQQPAEDSPALCALLKASYMLDGKHRLSKFAVKISHRGIALNPE